MYTITDGDVAWTGTIKNDTESLILTDQDSGLEIVFHRAELIWDSQTEASVIQF